MKIPSAAPCLLMLIAVTAACSPKRKEEAKPAAVPADAPDLVLVVGSIKVTQSDLDHQLQQSHGGQTGGETRRKALEELAARAQLAQAALDAGLENDPVVRAELARVLASRLKEKSLFPLIKSATERPVAESRLRELYAAGEARFRSGEKRQVAVLWLNPNGDPEREKQYVEKLNTAREWLANNADVKDHAGKGFSVLGVDYSEHQASRYNGGIVGWLESRGGMDDWTKALAEIVFSLKQTGEVSEVISRREGVFLVRYMALQAAVQRPFEAVAAELEQIERQSSRQKIETDFNEAIGRKYPVQWLKP